MPFFGLINNRFSFYSKDLLYTTWTLKREVVKTLLLPISEGILATADVYISVQFLQGLLSPSLRL